MGIIMTNSKSSKSPIDTWLEELISPAESIDPVIAMTPDDDHLPDACGTADVADIKALKASAKRPSQLAMNDELVMVCDYFDEHKTDHPPCCIWKTMATGRFEMDSDNDRVATFLHDMLQIVANSDGVLPLQRLGTAENLGDDQWWITYVADISSALQNLFPWMIKVTEGICNHLLFCGRFGLPIHIPPLLLVGQHGIGKTSYLNKLSELLNVRIRFVDVSGVSAGWTLTGSDSSWRQSKQGVIVETMLDFHAGFPFPIANPIIVLDEIDKESTESRYPLNTALLPLLEKATSKRFRDEFIRGMTWDISYMSFFATANSLQGISEPLLSRFQVVQITPPTEQQKYDVVLRMVAEYSWKIRDEMRMEDDLALYPVPPEFKFNLYDTDIAREIAKMESLRDIAWRLDDAVRRAVARNPLANAFVLMPEDFDLAPQKRTFGFLGKQRD
jgi:hypothetical protein